MNFLLKKIGKAMKFIEHIEEHLDQMDEFPEDAEVMCKICNKTIDDVWEEDELND